MIGTIIEGFIGFVIFVLLISGLKTIRPTERGLVETFGKYTSFRNPGLVYIIPFGIQRLVLVDITETMVDAGGQEIITKDKLNAMVDAQVYFKVKQDEINVKASQYNVYNCERQIVALARTTLRNIIGTLSLTEANSERGRINSELMTTLEKETKNWGIEVVRTELKEINPPADVQETMNKVVQAENEKTAAVDFATSFETKADGQRRALIKVAEGEKQAAILKAEGQAKAFDLINKSFIGNAQILKKLDVTQQSLQDNAKIIITKDGINLLQLLNDTEVKKKGKED
jgi:regulator of protease activity HflC (stomatin/prohibitin superfamily)